jgi:hypothetical protein
MKRIVHLKYSFCGFLTSVILICSWCSVYAQSKKHKASAPLYVDPMTGGSTDPVLVWNRKKKAWWMLYTQRRANTPGIGSITYAYGTKIGVASSHNHGRDWVYRGALNLKFQHGRNTFWAPDVIYHDGTYHMFVAYIKGVHSDWGGQRHIIHYTSKNLWDWTYKGMLHLSSDHVIDPVVIQMPDSIWRMFYKDEAHGSNIMCAKSKDLKHWHVVDKPATKGQSEGPIVFHYKGYYWLITDEWHGMRIYRSKHAKKWTKQGLILSGPSKRLFDRPHGSHGDVVITEGRAYIFYFTQPYHKRKAYVQVGQLLVKNGTLVCKRTHFNFWMGN